MKKVVITYCILILTIGLYAQTTGPWNLISHSGELSLMGTYREIETRGLDKYEFRKSTYYDGGIELNTQSYIWDKNFFILDANGEFNPGSRRELYLVMPDQSELRTHSSLYLKGTFFSESKFSLGGFYNLSNSFFNRETLTNIESDNQNWGTFLRWNNKVLPIFANYNKTNSLQNELPSGRFYSYDQDLFNIRGSRSFFNTDKHEISYTYNDYRKSFIENREFHTIKNIIRLYDNLYFDKNMKYKFTSHITYNDQNSIYNFQRFIANENLRIKLPYNFDLVIGNYNLSISKFDEQKQKRNQVRASIRHKLYESLVSRLFIEYTNINRYVSKEIQNKAGINFNYVKQLPYKSKIRAEYTYFKQINNTNGDPMSLFVFNEEHQLTDGEIVLLNKPYIDINSVVVSDSLGIEIFIAGQDYRLIERDGYIEIQRIAGGPISEGELVLIDYITNQPGSYKFNLDNHHLYAGLLIYNRLVELYYRRLDQTYSNLYMTEYLSLNEIHQNIFGVKFEYEFAECGAEYDMFESTIVPYTMWRYYLRLNKDFNKRFVGTLNGNIRDYTLTDYNLKRRYIDITGKVSYRIKDISTLNVEGGYRYDTGDNIDLKYLTFRAEAITNFKKLYLIIGYQMYQREYLFTEHIILNGGYIRLLRRF